MSDAAVFHPPSSRRTAWSVVEVFRHCWEYRELAWEMTKRDLKVINKGSALGAAWLVLGPTIQVMAYVAILSFVFGAGMKAGEGPFAYAMYVLPGMLPWSLMVRTFQESPTLIANRGEILKQVIYPVETLPWTSITSGLVGGAASFAVYLACGGLTGQLKPTLVLLPVPLVVLAALLLGAAWTLSVVGAVFKDLREIITLAMGILVYFSPVVAREEIVGAMAWRVILCNPLSHVVLAFRDVCDGTWHPASWLVFVGLAGTALLTGAAVIQQAKVRIRDYV